MNTELIKRLNQISAADLLLPEETAISASNTVRSKGSDLKSFMRFIAAETGKESPDLLNGLAGWGAITHDTVKKYTYYLLIEGYAIATVNHRLSTIRARVRLAAQARTIDTDTAAQIRAIKGYTKKQGRQIDKDRAVTRRGTKKEKATKILVPQTHTLKRTGAPKRRLIFCLMLDHGMRVGEVVTLKVSDLNNRDIVITRHKTYLTHTHTLTEDTQNALSLYLPPSLIKANGFLFPSATSRTGHISDRTIRRMVHVAGLTVGIDSLSCHDCRHSFLNKSLDSGTDIRATMQAGGWQTLEALTSYIEENEIANEGVVLP